MNTLFFDTETTGKYDWKLPPDHPSQPHLVQLAAVLLDNEGKERAGLNLLVKPEGFSISQEVTAIHGISEDIANSCGVSIKNVAYLFNALCYQADLLVAHNIDFDRSIMLSVFIRNQIGHRLNKMNRYCTMKSATPIVKAVRPGVTGDHAFKWPSLTECMAFFFQEDFSSQAHNALADVVACSRVYQALKSHGV